MIRYLPGMPNFEKISALLDVTQPDQPTVAAPGQPLDELTFTSRVQLRPGFGAVGGCGVDELNRVDAP
jgi:hypothetical protein